MMKNEFPQRVEKKRKAHTARKINCEKRERGIESKLSPVECGVNQRCCTLRDFNGKEAVKSALIEWDSGL